MLVDPCFLTNWCVSRGLNVTVVLFSNSITNTFKIYLTKKVHFLVTFFLKLIDIHTHKLVP